MAEENRRFYEKSELVKTSVEILSAFPRDLQGVVAKTLCQLVVRDYDIEGRMSQFRSLGIEMILPLYRSKNKLRSYDQIPEFHQAMNYLRLLNEQERIIIATKLLDVAGLVEYYLGFAGDVPMPRKQVDVGEIRDLYLSNGQDAAKAYVVQLSQELLSNCLHQKAHADVGKIKNQKSN